MNNGHTSTQVELLQKQHHDYVMLFSNCLRTMMKMTITEASSFDQITELPKLIILFILNYYKLRLRIRNCTWNYQNCSILILRIVLFFDCFIGLSWSSIFQQHWKRVPRVI